MAYKIIWKNEKLVQQLFITYQIPDKAIEINADIEALHIDIEKLFSNHLSILMQFCPSIMFVCLCSLRSH